MIFVNVAHISHSFRHNAPTQEKKSLIEKLEIEKRQIAQKAAQTAKVLMQEKKVAQAQAVLAATQARKEKARQARQEAEEQARFEEDEKLLAILDAAESEEAAQAAAALAADTEVANSKGWRRAKGGGLCGSKPKTGKTQKQQRGWRQQQAVVPPPHVALTTEGDQYHQSENVEYYGQPHDGTDEALHGVHVGEVSEHQEKDAATSVPNDVGDGGDDRGNGDDDDDDDGETDHATPFEPFVRTPLPEGVAAWLHSTEETDVPRAQSKEDKKKAKQEHIQKMLRMKAQRKQQRLELRAES